MKTNLSLLAALLLLGGVVASCDPRHNDPKVLDVTDSNKALPPSGIPPAGLSPATVDAMQANDPVAGILDDIKTMSYEDRSSLSTITDKMDRQVNALMARWKAAGREFPDKTEAQYENARKVLTGKLNALTFATPETWGTAKEEASVALQNVRGALHAMDSSAK